MKLRPKTKFGFWKSENGSAAMIAAIALPALVGFGALAVDVGHFYTLKTNMQQASDFAALSVLTQMRDNEQLNGFSASDAGTKYGSATAALANQSMPRPAKNAAVKPGDITFGNWDFNKQLFSEGASVFPTNAVRIKAEMSEQRNNPATTFFGKIFRDHVDVSVSSMAVLPLPKSFVLLSSEADKALIFRNGADIDTETIHVNSTSDSAFVAPSHPKDAGVFSIHVVGDMVGNSDDKYKTGSRPARDFLEKVPAVDFDDWPCIPNPELAGGGSHTLEPGRYCDGLTINDVDEVTFRAGGTFVIEGGPLLINAAPQSRPVRGEGVLIYLADEQADARIASADLSLSAKDAGPHAGIAIMTAPGLSPAPDIVLVDVDLYFSGIFYTPDSNVRARYGKMDGVCGYVCFVSGTLDLYGTNINVSPGNAGKTDPFGNIAASPALPPALMKTFRPYILNMTSGSSS
ncbi:MAG: hypothetical protein GY948_03240 [Alphaproteobacteria bacterium]|nr:hypothetical protein [Alphaproteobacteria bacterium]